MFAGFLVADKLLKNGTHAVVIQRGQFNGLHGVVRINWIRAEVNGRRHKFLNDRTKDIGINHGVYLIAELEFLQYLLYIG